jgi:hypothetical protein
LGNVVFIKAMTLPFCKLLAVGLTAKSTDHCGILFEQNVFNQRAAEWPTKPEKLF